MDRITETERTLNEILNVVGMDAIIVYFSFLDKALGDGYNMTEITNWVSSGKFECTKSSDENYKAFKNNARCDVMDIYSGHDEELVAKINQAWKSAKHDDDFGRILLAIAKRDEKDVFEIIKGKIETEQDALSHGWQILQFVCNDEDLEMILSFMKLNR